MADPYVGEIRMFGGNWAPLGWQICDGSLLPISAYEPLFNLIGTTYGGDGVNNFAVPDLRGRLPMHFSGTYPIGQKAGSETVTLTTQQIPSHNHLFNASNTPQNTQVPTNNLIGVTPTGAFNALYAPLSGTPAQLASQAIPVSGGGNQPHSNVQPFQCMTFMIALQGVYPTQS